MNKIKLLSLSMVILMMLSAFVSCKKNISEEEETTTSDNTISDDTETENTETENTETENTETENTVEDTTQDGPIYSEVIEVADAGGSAGLEGNFKAAFCAEDGKETRIVGGAQNPVCYSIYAAFSSPTLITRIVLTAPSSNQESLASATIDASSDGMKWTTLCTLDEGLVAGKNYSFNISNDRNFTYIRIRQSESLRTEKFTFRNMVIEGVPYEGPSGEIEKVDEEIDMSIPLIPQNILVSNKKSGNAENIFVDNVESYTANYSTDGKTNYIIGTLPKSADIRKVTVKLWDLNRSARGTTLQVSNDGVNWKVLCELPDLRADGTTSESKEFTYYLNLNEDYSYVKLAQNTQLSPYEEWTLNTVLLYGVPSVEESTPFPKKFIDADTVGVTHHGANVINNSGGDVPDVIWNTDDKTTSYTHKPKSDMADGEQIYISGKLDAPTVITEIIYYSPASNATRVRSSYFEASVDGVNWVRVATLTGTSSAYNYSATLNMVVYDDTEYNYIRLVQNEGFHQYYWTVGTVEIKGISKS